MNHFSMADLLHLAESTALLAGRQLHIYQQEWSAVETELDRDIKIKADKLAEEIILNQLKSATNYPILTEETGWHGTNGDLVWVVDPLDGSFNYHKNIPFCCVAISLVQNAIPQLGVIYDFNHDELFSGEISQGARLNNHPISVSDITSKKNGVLNTGFPARRDYSDSALIDFFKSAQSWRKIRMMGSAALALAYVAAGRADAYQESGTLFWDVAAGCALVKAAGGEFKLEGDTFKSPLNVWASNGKL